VRIAITAACTSGTTTRSALIYGTGEQMLPLLTGEVEVVARSKDSGAQVIRFLAQVDTPDQQNSG